MLEAISTMEMVHIEILVPQPPKKIKVVGNPKRKATASKKPSFTIANSSHYLNFIKTLDQMDMCREMKGFYLAMDHSLIHDIKKKDGKIEKK
jgi:hypothetical protein